ncbi:MAG: LCP family protein [Microgenomates group bacterium]
MIIKKIILAIFLSLLVLLGSWYFHNQTAKNIVRGVIKNPENSLISYQGRTNILLLGMGGVGHEGGDLTDSILFISLNLSSKDATIISIPRDIWVPSLAAKINTAYHYGNEKRPGGGLDLAKSAVSETLGVPVHYAIALDFQGFVKAIDALGGIDVVVDNAFDDYKYPVPGKETAEPESARYEHIHFDAGSLHMDGSTALKFARSRHAEGDEGTDFARGNRQTKIIAAFRNKSLSTSTIFSNSVLADLKSSITSSINTDIGEVEQGGLFKVLISLGSTNNINNLSIADYLINPKSPKPYGGQWVLLADPSEELKSYVKKNLGN